MTLYHTQHDHYQATAFGMSGASILWDADTQWLLTFANVVIAISFVVVSVAFFQFLRQRKDLTLAKPSLMIFVVLLSLSAATRLAEVYTIWQPAPWLFWLLKGMMALTSVITAVAVWPLIPRLLKIPSAKTLQEINLKLQNEITERARVEEVLKLHQDHLELLVQARTQDLENTTQRLRDEVKQRKEAQDQVAFQASLLDQLESAIIASNNERKIVYWNQYAEKLLGWTAEEVIGRSIEEVLIKESGRKQQERRIARLKQDKRWEGDLKMLHRGGHAIPIHASSTVLQDHCLREIGYAFVCFDMSEQVRVNNRLQKAKVKAEKAAVAKQDFLSTMSHEIRTPLNVVIGMARLLIDEDPKPEQLEYLKSLQFSANNLLVIINDILDFSKIEAGKVKLERINFSIREVIEGVVNAFLFRAGEKGLALKFTVDEAIPERMMGDQVRLTQVLNNLVSNAMKFTEQGFVSIHVNPLNSRGEHIDIGFEVRDSGIGISQHKIRTIFNSFTQATSDTTRKFGGTGLGLTICKRLVELQGGSIQVNSKEGIGSTFGFTLPYRKTEQQGSPSLPEAENYQLGNVRVLLVEDNPSNRMVACSFLGKMGVQVTVAENGLEALETVQAQRVDIILMDLQMPRMDGYEATQAIRQLGGKYKKLPIIALTADVVSDVKERAAEAGMNDYLSKPFNPSVLYRKISSNLNLPTTFPSVPEESDILSLSDIVAKYDNDAGFVAKLLESLRRSFKSLPQQVENFVEGKNVGELRRMIHKLIPTIRMVKNYELQEQLDELKRVLSNDPANEERMAQLVQAIEQSSQVSLHYVDRLAEPKPVAEPS